MKNKKNIINLLIVISFFMFFLYTNVQARGGHSGGHSSGHVSSHSSSHSSSSHVTSKSHSSGLKKGSFSISKPSLKNNHVKIVNVNSKALKSIPPKYSSHSVSNNYYYNTNNGGSSFWSNYWIYRSLTPHNRTYVTTGGINHVAPAYTGINSILADVITAIVIIIIIFIVVYIIKRRNRY